MDNKNGYKSFNSNFETFNNIKLEPNKTYELSENIKYHKYGYHFAKRLEDTLRYVNGLEEEIIICPIKVLGKVDWYDDEYYGYYDLGCTNKIFISSPLTRENILEYAYKLPDYSLIRFIQGYKLTKEELEHIKEFYQNNKNIINNIKYYQEKDIKVFKREYKINGKN